MRAALALSSLSLLLGAAPLARNFSPAYAAGTATARAEGNRPELARAVGERLFTHLWPAQVLKVHVDGVGAEAAVGLVVSGAKFHATLTRAAFLREVAALIGESFQAVSAAREVDLWVTVPIHVAPGTIVSGSLAQPTSRDVFAVSVRRGESAAHLLARLQAGRGIFQNEEWSRMAFKPRA